MDITLIHHSRLDSIYLFVSMMYKQKESLKRMIMKEKSALKFLRFSHNYIQSHEGNKTMNHQNHGLFFDLDIIKINK